MTNHVNGGKLSMFAQAYIIPDGGTVVVCNNCKLPEYLGIHPEVIADNTAAQMGYLPICEVCGGNFTYQSFWQNHEERGWIIRGTRKHYPTARITVACPRRLAVIRKAYPYALVTEVSGGICTRYHSCCCSCEHGSYYAAVQAKLIDPKKTPYDGCNYVKAWRIKGLHRQQVIDTLVEAGFIPTMHLDRVKGKYAILTVGVPGSGKSYTADWYVTYKGLVQVELDKAREVINGNAADQSNIEEAIALRDKWIQEASDAGKSIVISDTNLNKHFRDVLIAKLKGMGYKVMLDVSRTPHEVSRKRNAERTRRVDDDVMDRMIAAFDEQFGPNAEFNA